MSPLVTKKVVGASSSLVREQDAPSTLWEYFNPLTEIDIRTGGKLPHWEQGSVWYFLSRFGLPMHCPLPSLRR